MCNARRTACKYDHSLAANSANSKTATKSGMPAGHKYSSERAIRARKHVIAQESAPQLAACILVLLCLQMVCAALVAAEADTAGETPTCSSRDENRKFYLSVGAIFRDENKYLGEWLEFHLCQGVEHFFLYNHHSSSDVHERILAPYIAQGIVTLDEAVCDMHCQVPTYTLLFEQHASKTRWLALIDIDEFLMPSPTLKHMPASSPSLPKILEGYEQFGGVVVHWVVFGSSFHNTAPEGLVVENFQWRGAEAHEIIKTIAQPAKVAVVGGHNHQYISGETAVNDVQTPVPFNDSIGEAASSHAPPSVAVLRLHHYRTKSRQHALWRFERDATFRLNEFENQDIYPSSPETQAAWLAKWDVNEVHDESAQRFAACITKGLESRAAPTQPTS
mmetsp:Transcript_50425/g.81437  ORF Transcript_50425/g.81437 Transcript_50425/m.81437 type:complete len:390 (+) Transcript_50425:94-1263(+)